jgi:hypothetical protein
MHPGNVKADLTESLLELIVEGLVHDADMTYANMDDTATSSISLNEETLEDLHLTETTDIDFLLLTFSDVEHNYYRYTPDIKNHVFSVVMPPPDFC